MYSISDINNIIDYYLFLNFIQGRDNSDVMKIKNTFITIKKYNGKNVILYTPWDLDLSFGNAWDFKSKNNTFSYYYDTSYNHISKLNSVYILMQLGDKKISSLIKDKYKILREGFWSDEYISNMILGYSHDIYDSGAFSRDKNRWPNGNYNSEVEKLTRFEKYVLERLYYLDKYVDSL